MPFDFEEFGKRLRVTRDKNKLTQEEFAALIGANRSWISELEHSRQRWLRADTVVRCAEALGVSTDYLLGLSDDHTRPQDYVPADASILAITEHQQTCAWYPASDPPPHNGPVWGFCPAWGNADEGFGAVLVVRHDLWPAQPGWVTCRGAPIVVTRWAWLVPPAMPESWRTEAPQPLSP